MPPDANAALDEVVLELIERSPTGSVPHTPTHQDALRRLQAAHHVYASADHPGGHVTARSLARRPVFHASNLDALAAGQIGSDALEANGRVFDRYLQSLPEPVRARAELLRARVVGRPVLHRKSHVAADGTAAHDPVHSVFLVPGTGPNVGLPGEYLHGALSESPHPGAPEGWTIHVHDSDDGAAFAEAATLAAAVEKLQELLASAPFHLSELAVLGFVQK